MEKQKKALKKKLPQKKLQKEKQQSENNPIKKAFLSRTPSRKRTFLHKNKKETLPNKTELSREGARKKVYHSGDKKAKNKKKKKKQAKKRVESSRFLQLQNAFHKKKKKETVPEAIKLLTIKTRRESRENVSSSGNENLLVAFQRYKDSHGFRKLISRSGNKELLQTFHMFLAMIQKDRAGANPSSSGGRKQQKDTHRFLGVKKGRKKEEKKKENLCIIKVSPRPNNMMFTLVDTHGNTHYTLSGGSLGYKNAQKKTWTTVRECSLRMNQKATEKGFTGFLLDVKKQCSKRKSAYRGMTRGGCPLYAVIYRTPTPHNGCRPSKKRRK